MILGLSVAAFTTVHVAISLVALATGGVVTANLLDAHAAPRWTIVFLATTVFTTLTGFLLPADSLLPSHVFGILSLVVLSPAMVALYVFGLARAWRGVYVIGALIAFYLNAFVAVVQAFQKIPVLTPLAPTQSEPAFVVAQLVLLALVVFAGVLAFKRYRPLAQAA